MKKLSPNLLLAVIFLLFFAEQSLAQNVHLSVGLLKQERGEPLRDSFGNDVGGHTVSKFGLALSYPLSDQVDIRYEYTWYGAVGAISEGMSFEGLSIEVELF